MKATAMRKAGFSLLIAALLTWAPMRINSQERRLVKMTLVRSASSIGAYCLDGSLPAYHLDRGFGAGERNWLLQFEATPTRMRWYNNTLPNGGIVRVPKQIGWWVVQ